MSEGPRGFDRREFLRRSALGVGVGSGLALAGPGTSALGAAVGASARPEPSGPPRIRRYVELGQTGLKVSDIGFGAARLKGDEDLVRYALDRGVNYFDTSEIYAEGESERTLGKALAGRRDEVVLVSKQGAEADARKAQMMSTLEASLKRLRTDHVDIYFNHALNDVERLKNPEWGEFVEAAKAQGKLRFTGISGHGAQWGECLEYALDHELVDVVLSAYNYAQDPGYYLRLKYAYQQLWREADWVAYLPDIRRVIAKARKKGVGVLCMKTLRGARLNDMRPYELGRSTFAQAGFRWVLSNPDVDGLLATMESREQVDEFLVASGSTQPAPGDLALLGRYEAANGRSICHQGCNRCAGACPHEVPIPEVLRTRMYARDYESEDLARSEYAQLGLESTACLSCAHRACAGACPFGLPIDELTRDAQKLLG